MASFGHMGIALPAMNNKLDSGAASNNTHPTTAQGGGYGWRFCPPKDGTIDRVLVRDEGGAGGTVVATLYETDDNNNAISGGALAVSASTVMVADADTMITFTVPYAVTRDKSYMITIETDSAVNVSFSRHGSPYVPVLGTAFGGTQNFDATNPTYGSDATNTNNIPCCCAFIYDDNEVFGGQLVSQAEEQQNGVWNKVGMKFRMPWDGISPGVFWGNEMDSNNPIQVYIESEPPNGDYLTRSWPQGQYTDGTAGVASYYHNWRESELVVEANTWYYVVYQLSGGSHVSFVKYLDSGNAEINQNIRNYMGSGSEIIAAGQLDSDLDNWVDDEAYMPAMALNFRELTIPPEDTAPVTSFNRLR